MRRATAVVCLSVLFVSILTCQRRSIPRPEIVYPFEDGLGVFCIAPVGTELRYIVDWGDGVVDTTEQSFAPCDTALLPLRGGTEHNAEVRAKAISACTLKTTASSVPQRSFAMLPTSSRPDSRSSAARTTPANTWTNSTGGQGRDNAIIAVISAAVNSLPILPRSMMITLCRPTS